MGFFFVVFYCQFLYVEQLSSRAGCDDGVRALLVNFPVWAAERCADVRTPNAPPPPQDQLEGPSGLLVPVHLDVRAA